MANARPPCSTPCSLPGYECAADLPGVTHSKEKLESSLEDFASIPCCPLQDLPSSRLQTLTSTEEETLGYRCSCAFQIVGLDTGAGEGARLEYCMRNDFRAVPIGVDRFPGAQRKGRQTEGLMLPDLPARVLSASKPNVRRVSFLSHHRCLLLTIALSRSSSQSPTRAYRRPWPESYRLCVAFLRRISVPRPLIT